MDDEDHAPLMPTFRPDDSNIHPAMSSLPSHSQPTTSVRTVSVCPPSCLGVTLIGSEEEGGTGSEVCSNQSPISSLRTPAPSPPLDSSCNCDILCALSVRWMGVHSRCGWVLAEQKERRSFLETLKG
ncbi:hypothetical protein BLNAU_4131 [Blattamonas nauphoetae]|uniref:Uncharacterized protein n=1 Tax=Blattamonas nauphoetae TaxID=2049346 RepID=A0ABQ9YBF1_9EUKA|nr:hypothetical protein BLNAU_4131 [Blattamonas nauphoetae]